MWMKSKALRSADTERILIREVASIEATQLFATVVELMR